MSETRFADRSADRDGESVELVLSPDTYAVLVMAKGYDASELPAQSIEGGKTTILDSVALHPGSAKVRGTVTGDTWTADTLWVELVGEGRRPCQVCADGPGSANRQSPPHGQRWSKADYCPRCGYGKASSRLAVPPDGRFVFEGLTRGPYAVRLMDVEERTLCDPRFLELEVGQSYPLEIRFAAPRRVRVEIVDTDGASLAPEWAARLRKQAADDEGSSTELIVENPRQPLEFQCQFRTEHLQIGSSSFTPPPPDLAGTVAFGVAAFGSRKMGIGGRHHDDLDDRPRAKSDSLRPEIAPANVSPGYFPSEVDADGVVRFESVPSLQLTLTLLCGPFAATVEIPSSRDEVRLPASLHLVETPKASAAETASTDARTYRDFEIQRMH